MTLMDVFALAEALAEARKKILPDHDPYVAFDIIADAISERCAVEFNRAPATTVME